MAHTHTSLASLFSDIADAIRSHTGLSESIVADNFPDAISEMAGDPVLESEDTTVQYDSSRTENIATNNHIRIHGSDGKKYTLAEWNALFVAAGYNKDLMTVEPIGINFTNVFGIESESYIFDRYAGRIYNIVGLYQAPEGQLQHSAYNDNAAAITSAASGTDSTTSKQWNVTDNGDDTLTLYEANTGRSWVISKNNGHSWQHRAFNVVERTYALWAINEWKRHRFAIASGISTSAEDGTIGEVSILNSNGEAWAVGEDMYFWIDGQNTGLLAKYNLNNKHNTSGYQLTQAVADAIYESQKSVGVDMNDSGPNSSSKPILSEGSKGAEAIAVDGVWYIITPYITNPSATLTENANMADAPAVYYAISKGFALPSDSLLQALYQNKTLVNALRNYLVNREGWSLKTIVADSVWSAVRYSAKSAWFVNISNGYVYYNNPSYRFNAGVASAS